jgi:hypothetical protein
MIIQNVNRKVQLQSPFEILVLILKNIIYTIYIFWLCYISDVIILNLLSIYFFLKTVLVQLKF